MTRRDKKLLALLEDYLRAQAGGVVCRLADWKRMTSDEKRSWLAARKLLLDHAPKAEPDAPVAPDAQDEDVDLELRAVLEKGSA